MKVTIIPIVIGAFGTETKGLLKGLEDLGVVKNSKGVNNCDYTTKWYMHKPESVPENETQNFRYKPITKSRLEDQA